MPNMNERDGENSADLYTLCGSLVEGYKRNDIAIHCHFAVEFGGHPSCGNFCVEIKRDSEFDKRYPVDFASTSNGGARPENGQQYPSVFVDIAEIIETKERWFPSIAPDGTVAVSRSLPPHLGVSRQVCGLQVLS